MAAEKRLEGPNGVLVAGEADYLFLLAAFPIFVFVRFLRSYRCRLMVQR
jgi:hypothetical protein